MLRLFYLFREIILLLFILSFFNHSIFGQSYNKDRADSTSYLYTLNLPIKNHDTIFKIDIKFQILKAENKYDVDQTSFIYSFYKLNENILIFNNYIDILYNNDNKDFNILYNEFNTVLIGLYINKKVDYTSYIYSNVKSINYCISDSIYNNCDLDQSFQFYNDTARIRQIKRENLRIVFRNYNFSKDWIFSVLILSLISLVWARIIYGGYLNRLQLTVFNYISFTKLFREKSVLLNKASKFYNFNFIVVISLFLHLCNQFFVIFKFEYHPLVVFFIISSIVYMIVFVKRFILKIIGFLIDEKNVVDEYIFSINSYNQLIGIILVPFVIAVPYIVQEFTFYFIYGGLFIILIFNALKIFRGSKIFFTKGYSIFYLILYFCALEILPVLIMWKVYKIMI